jgi:hypothetical protein
MNAGGRHVLERRLGEIESGTARTYPADDVIKEARTLLK